MCITMFSIAKAISTLPVGFAYATYSGLTVTGTVLFAVLKFNQAIKDEIGEESLENFHNTIEKINHLIKNKKIFSF